MGSFLRVFIGFHVGRDVNIVSVGFLLGVLRLFFGFLFCPCVWTLFHQSLTVECMIMRYPTKGGNKFQDGGWQQRSKRRASEVLDAVPFKRWITNAILYDALCNENPFATTYTRKFLRRSLQGAQLIWFQIQSYNAVRQRWHSLFLSIAIVVVFILNLLFWWMIFFQNGGGQLSSKVSTDSIKWVQFVKRKLEILSYPVCYVYASVLLKERKQDHRCYLIGSFVFDL